MSLQLAAQHLAAHGRGNDNMLVHMTPSEVNKLQELAMAHGGSLTINPHTGLVEAGFLESLLKTIAPIALGAFLGPAGAGIGGGLFESALGAAGAVGLGTAALTGDIGKGLTAGLSAYGGAELGGSLMGMGNTTIGAGAVEAAKAAALEKGLTGEAYNQFIQQSVTDEIGKASIFDKLGAGAKTIANDPTNTGFNFLKQNAIPLAAVAAPIIADQMVETNVDMPKLESNAAIRPYDYDPTTQTFKALPVTKLAEGGTTMPTPNTNFDVLKAYDEMFGKPRGIKTATEMPVEMPSKSQSAYDYLMGKGNYNPPPPPAPAAAAPSSAPTSSPGEGYYEYDPVTQTYKWHPKAAPSPTATAASTDANTGINDPNLIASGVDLTDPYGMTLPRTYGPTWDNRGGSGKGGSPDPTGGGNSNWGSLTDQQKSAYFVDNPGMAKVQDAVLTGWGMTLPGMVQNALDPSQMQTQRDILARADEARQLKNALEAGAKEPGPEIQRNAYEVQRGLAGLAGEGNTDGGGSTAGMVYGGEKRGWYTPSGSSSLSNTQDPLGTGGTEYGRVDPSYRGGSEAATGGLLDSRYAHGGGIADLYNLGSYSDGGRLLRGPGDGVSDSIPAVIGQKQPARLADGEFVVPARIVSELGNGSTDAGARKLYAMMNRIQNARKQTVGKGKVAANSRSEKYLPR